jgi:putative methanogen marker protein 4
MKILAGVGENKNIVEASHRVDFPVDLLESEEAFADAIIAGKAQAYVRGSLSASIVMNRLKKSNMEIYRGSFLEINGHKFLLAPVGIDEGDHLIQKLHILELGTEFLEKININAKIAILSSGRAQDLGRSKKIDDSIAQGELLTRIIKNKYQVKHHHILIEEAIADKANFILAPDGITGNLIFRSLVLLGSGKSYGAITLGIDEIFVDTSRSLDVGGYVRALKFARYLADENKKRELEN